MLMIFRLSVHRLSNGTRFQVSLFNCLYTLISPASLFSLYMWSYSPLFISWSHMPFLYTAAAAIFPQLHFKRNLWCIGVCVLLNTPGLWTLPGPVAIAM
eukprot:2220252-Karenia_brevis.AAC.1